LSESPEERNEVSESPEERNEVLESTAADILPPPGDGLNSTWPARLILSPKVAGNEGL
jgi:hypothetical protein